MRKRNEQLYQAMNSYILQPQHIFPSNLQHDERVKLILTCLGFSFVQGYRICEHRTIQLLMLSSMQYNEPKFKLLCIQFDDRFQKYAYRCQLYDRILDFCQWFTGKIQIQMLCVSSGKEAMLSLSDIRAKEWVNLRDFYCSIQFLSQAYNGHYSLHEKTQGTNLHLLVEMFVKGGGIARNRTAVDKVQGRYRYKYDLFKVVNTICMVVAREMVEGGYETLTAEKWLRKSTKKAFRRLDLLMRSKRVCGVLDWKFSVCDAEDKINHSQARAKNPIYYQLVTKDFLPPEGLSLKFYCFHEKKEGAHHAFSVAKYHHSIALIHIPETDSDSDCVEIQIYAKERQTRMQQIQLLSNTTSTIDLQHPLPSKTIQQSLQLMPRGILREAVERKVEEVRKRQKFNQW